MASKRLPLKSAKARNELLSFVVDDLAEAYQIGAEETQWEIICRLQTLAKNEDQSK